MFESYRRHKAITIYQYYQLSWIGLLPCALILAGLARVMPLWLSVPTLGLCLLTLSSRAIFSWWTPKNRGRIVWTYALLVWAYAIAYYVRSEDFFAIIAEFLAGLLPILLSRKHKTFGHWIALFTAILIALIGVIGGSGMIEYLLLILMLGFVVFNLNAANLMALSGPTGSLQQRLPRRYFKQLLPSLSVGFLAGVLIFFFFPRAPRFWNPFSIRQRGGVTTAYTGTVSLKASPPISESSSLALLVESENPEWLTQTAPTIYFRGNTLDHFDGQDWSAPNRPAWPYTMGSDLRFTLASRLPARRLKVFREPHSTQAVIYPHVLLSINAPMNVLGSLSYDANSSLIRSHREDLRYSYEVLVSEPVLPRQLSNVTLAELRGGIGRENRSEPMTTAIHPAARPQFLQLPPALRGADYFRNWVNEVGVDPDKDTLLALFQKLEKHFQGNFRPSLARQNASADTFRSFLVDERKGHCEYFATAGALFLRALGIPSRIVLGYRGGTWNNVSRVLEVREQNAHAWVEAYFPLTGWVTFDPTPMMTQPMETGFSLYASLYWNAAHFWFNRYVVNYNTQAQRDLLRTFFRMDKQKAEGMPIIPWNLRTAQFLLVLTFTILFLFHLRRRPRAIANQISRLPDYYELFQKKLALGGWKRKDAETFGVFHDRLHRSGAGPGFLADLDLALEQELYAPVKRRPTATRDFKTKIRAWKLPRKLSPAKKQSRSL